MNRNKDSCWINLGLVDITTEYILNFSQDVLPNPRTATHIDLLSSPTSHSETKSNHPRRSLTFSQKLLQVSEDLKEVKKTI